MAAITGASLETIVRDLRELRKDLIAEIDPKRGQQLLAERIRTYQMVIELATAKLEHARGNVYTGLLNQISSANRDLSKLLQEVGIVEAAQMVVEETNPAGEKTTTTITAERPCTDSHMIELLKRFDPAKSVLS
jgi:hypothetical protein